MIANETNITKRSDLERALSHREGDKNFQELINLIIDLKAHEAASNPHPQYKLAVKDNASSDRSPTITDDETEGYSLGSTWYNTSSPEIYRCIDATEGNAVWIQTTLTIDELGSAATVDVQYLVNRTNHIGSQLSSSISDLGNSSGLIFESMSLLQQSDNVKINDKVFLTGFYKENDGGSGWFVIKDIGDVDDVRVFDMANGLKAHMVVRKVINVNCFGVLGDGNDYTDKLIAAADSLGKGYTLYFPVGEYVVSRPVNLNGASITGDGMFSTTISAKKGVGSSNWKIGPENNDVAMFYNRNQDDWFCSNIKFDGQEEYTCSISAQGGKNIVYCQNYFLNFANAAQQFMGKRRLTDRAIENSVMTLNISEGCRWGYVMDGSSYGVSIINNVSINPTNRHISIDANEAVYENDIRGLLVANNVCRGYRPHSEIESIWDYNNVWADAAINVKSNTWGSIVNNVIYNWSTDSSSRNIYGIKHTGSGSLHVCNNLVHCEHTEKKIDSVFKLENDSKTGSPNTGSIYMGNTAFNVNNGFDLSNVDISDTESITIQNNNINGSDTGKFIILPVNKNSDGLEGWFILMNVFRDTIVHNINNVYIQSDWDKGYKKNLDGTLEVWGRYSPTNTTNDLNLFAHKFYDLKGINPQLTVQARTDAARTAILREITTKGLKASTVFIDSGDDSGVDGYYRVIGRWKNTD